ncbi:MAG TPA: S-layer protein, partial [Verrucomicrobiales bacterium]|nr:S-layer protein [Verrucomicrobiales bacterium]
MPLNVTAHYDDGSERDVTALTEFVSEDKELVTVDEGGVMRVGEREGESVVVARFMGQIDAARVTVPTDVRLSPDRYAGLPVANYIDELAYAHFQKLGLFPSARSSDGEFLRRSTLDTIGRLPTVDEAREFLADPSGDKRSRWIERLLADPAWADYWANKWAD